MNDTNATDAPADTAAPEVAPLSMPPPVTPIASAPLVDAYNRAMTVTTSGGNETYAIPGLAVTVRLGGVDEALAIINAMTPS